MPHANDVVYTTCAVLKIYLKTALHKIWIKSRTGWERKKNNIFCWSFC